MKPEINLAFHNHTTRFIRIVDENIEEQNLGHPHFIPVVSCRLRRSHSIVSHLSDSVAEKEQRVFNSADNITLLNDSRRS